MKKILLTSALTLLCAIVLAACDTADDESKFTQQRTEPEPEQTQAEEPAASTTAAGFDQFAPPAPGEEYAVITTDFGVIELRLFPEYAPMAVENFVTLARRGYYDGVTFHRIMQNFMIQGGCPLGTGGGGDSIYGDGFAIEPNPDLRHFYGAFSMARTPSKTTGQGSQFFIINNNRLDDQFVNEFNYAREHQNEEIAEGSGVTISEYYPTWILDRYIEFGGVPFLDFDYTVFGQVFSGMDAVDAISAVETAEDARGEKSVPVNNVYMNKVEIKVYGER
jgi:cyclophilin family peptidyl-prolyl cis-trans isomerase